MTPAELALIEIVTREQNRQFIEILNRIESKICYERQQSDILFDRLVQCKAANRALSQKCKELVKSKGVRIVPRVCAFCEHYKVKRSETIGQGAGFPITVVSCENLGYGVLADPLLSCPKFQMKKLGMKEEAKK